MKRAEDEFAKENLKVIWMGFQDKKDKIMEFMTKHDIDSSVGFDDRNIIANKYEVRYGAGLVMITSEGIVKKRINSGITEDRFIEAVKYIINDTGDKVLNKK